MSKTGLTEVLLNEKKLYKPSAKVLKHAKVKQWKATIDKANKDPLKFWEEAAEELEWYGRWHDILDDSDAPFFKWFVNGKCNIVHNCLDRHIGTPTENKTAIIWESDSGKRRKLTYKQLYKEVNKLANGLKFLKVRKGDRVAIYLQNIPETAIAMLACAKIGAVHSVVYAGYSANALRERIDDQAAKILITSDVGHRRGKIIDMKWLCDKAISGSPSIQHVIVIRQDGVHVPMKMNRDIFYDALVETQPDVCKTEVMDAEDPLFILYTSGTTAKPKGVVHVHGGYMVGIHRTFEWIFDVKENDIYWCTADPGWITGHSYIVYAPLMSGVTTVMFEGVPDYPKPDRIWRLVDKYKINILYTAPTLIRALMRYGDSWPKKHSLKSLRLLGSVGEPINPEAWRWYHKVIGKSRCPIMDTWWQTETGMIMISPLSSMPLKAGSATLPFPGIQAEVVDKNGKPVPAGKGGYLVIKNPWPSMLRTVFKNPQRYLDTYWKDFPGLYNTDDLAHKDKGGYFWIQGRGDDVLSIAGHRIGNAEIESAIVSHKAAAEAGVIGKPHPVKGESAKAFVILKKGYEPSDKLIDEIKKHIRSELGPIAITDEIEFVDKLPKTRSGKIMRRVLKAWELGQDAGDTSALAD
ncbi:acetate--CoA ligase [Patescibacteria group bacterium]|nr:acetate--CoA ligase [Patescibacteria group bacterium]MBU1682977.1 acetate--CoA ligase [Patescibacteria group bacterium]MBU1935207.1 acetate--CoA ligase [Patescibacteria group bacterium]